MNVKEVLFRYYVKFKYNIYLSILLLSIINNTDLIYRTYNCMCSYFIGKH